MKKRTIILIHFSIWLMLSVGHLFASEPIAAWLFPGYHTIELWLKVFFAGLIVIFIGVLISLVTVLMRRVSTAKTGHNRQ